MRWLEGTRLHPLIDDKGVRRFKASYVERLAKEMQAEQCSPRNAQQAVMRAAEMPRASSRCSCSSGWSSATRCRARDALRVPPEDVRELYHSWLVGLWAGELQRKEPALPARHTDREASRWITSVQLAQLLAAPAKQSARISAARVIGDLMIPDEADPNGFVEYRNLCELGGFDASGPIAIADILARVGAGEYRLSSYGFEPRGLRAGACQTAGHREEEAMTRLRLSASLLPISPAPSHEPSGLKCSKLLQGLDGSSATDTTDSERNSFSASQAESWRQA